ncbi:hypothetical protein DFH09DRAFT_1081480 [Mycena vulgaris]|nr:hypothetical protein DFH09DRAFT_1081480 [Mycena vulgaris]
MWSQVEHPSSSGRRLQSEYFGIINLQLQQGCPMGREEEKSIHNFRMGETGKDKAVPRYEAARSEPKFGFNSVAPQVLAVVKDQLAQFTNYTTVSTGHSLGAFLASLAGVSLGLNFFDT